MMMMMMTLHGVIYDSAGGADTKQRSTVGGWPAGELRGASC